MKQYLDLLNKILTEGVVKESGRPNMPNTMGISNGIIRMDINEGFPLLTTKKMAYKLIIHELLWFLRGDTNIKYLVDNDVKIWSSDAYRWYQKWWNEAGQYMGGLREIKTIEKFVEQVKQDSNCEYDWIFDKKYTIGDLGKIYGHQWRNQNGVDQIKNIIDGLKSNPYSRYHIINGWNASDFHDMALPPCHLLYQFIVRPFKNDDIIHYLNKYYLMYDQIPWTSSLIEENGGYEKINEQYNVPKFYLDLNMYQRSCDTFLGVPFNLASMSLLLLIIAKVSNMMPGIATWIGGDVHLYLDHILLAKEQIEREPYELPHLSINKIIDTLDDILQLTVDDFELINYRSHPPIKAELFTGLKQ